MKKVLFATTAAAALSISGAAFAGGHDSGNFGLSGKTSIGYNDEIESGIFMDTDINMKAVKSVGDYEIGATVEFDYDWNEGQSDDSTTFGLDNAYVDTPVGKLTFLESNDGGSASDIFYNDRDGMALDVLNLDGEASLLWEGSVGQFEYAIDSGNIENAVDDDMTIGFGTAFETGAGSIDFGVGYDNNVSDSTLLSGSTFGVSADFDLGMFSVGLSYADGEKYDDGADGMVDSGTLVDDTLTSETSMAVVLGFEVTPELEVGVYYADNDVAANEYGATLDYASGAFSIGVDYHTGDNSFDENIEVDISYDTGAGATLYVGYDDNETNYDGGAGAFYAGAEIDIADGITATVAYAEADEIGGPEFKGGTSAFLTISY